MVVLGAGVGGLAAGYFLARTGKYQVTVLEKELVIGGLCASFEHDGFVLDYGAHKLYSVIPGVLDEVTALMGERLLRLPKKNRLFLDGHLVDYPLKLGNLAKVLGPVRFLKLGLGYAIQVGAGLFRRNPPRSYEEYIIHRFGRPTYELVFEPLAEKVWGDPASLHPEMARTRLPASGGMDLILRLLGLRKETADTNAEYFFYPRAGFGDWPHALAEGIRAHGGKVLTSVAVQGLELEDGKLASVLTQYQGETKRFDCDYLISSLPLAMLGRMVFGDKDPEFDRAIEGLQFRHLLLVYISVKRPLVLEDQWIFFPQRNVVFSRLFEQKQMNPELGPANRTVITADQGRYLRAQNTFFLDDHVVIVEAGSLAEVKRRRLAFDLVLVNILAKTIVELCDEGLAETINPGGQIVCAGLIESQEDEVREALERAGLEVIERFQDKDWVGLACRRALPAHRSSGTTWPARNRNVMRPLFRS